MILITSHMEKKTEVPSAKELIKYGKPNHMLAWSFYTIQACPHVFECPDLLLIGQHRIQGTYSYNIYNKADLPYTNHLRFLMCHIYLSENFVRNRWTVVMC